MSTPNDGGPAFPETRWDDKTRQEVQWCGMTLRDWFAGQALNGLLSDPNTNGKPNQFADDAYRYADAMLKARGQ